MLVLTNVRAFAVTCLLYDEVPFFYSEYVYICTVYPLWSWVVLPSPTSECSLSTHELCYHHRLRSVPFQLVQYCMHKDCPTSQKLQLKWRHMGGGGWVGGTSSKMDWIAVRLRACIPVIGSACWGPWQSHGLRSTRHCWHARRDTKLTYFEEKLKHSHTAAVAIW